MKMKGYNNVHSLHDYPKYNKKIKNQSENKWSATTSNALNYTNVGDGYMYDDYIRRPEFEEHKRHLDHRFNSLDQKVDGLKNSIDNKNKELKDTILLHMDNNLKDFKLELNEQNKVTRRWLIGTLIAIIGLSGRIFGLY
ncbi:hypothetical protein [Macrococcus equi]|uniref:hypothetical protein n=1 Tax=Macrococcus equi TaxID=3395462 RepID=UPI0039BE0772